MSCFKPLEGFWKDPSKNEGKSGFTTNRKLGFIDRPLNVPCGQCIGCRLEKSRQWAIRCMHEASQHLDNAFVTLTYSEDNVPRGLDRTHIQKFHKRLRKKNKFRFFYCGEYGDQTERPHFHTLLFGYWPKDAKPVAWNSDGTVASYESKSLEETWGLGHIDLGHVTFESAAYVARYSTKKITGDAAEEHYQKIDPETGEIYNIEPEFLGMSLKPGIGADWFEKYGKDSYKKDEIIMRGYPMKPPIYYDKLIDQADPELWQKVRQLRAKERANKELDPRAGTYNLYEAQTLIAEQKLQKRNLSK